MSIEDCAVSKADAKIIMLKLDLKRLNEDIKCKNNGAITMEQLILVRDGTIRELKIWEHIKNKLWS